MGQSGQELSQLCLCGKESPEKWTCPKRNGLASTCATSKCRSGAGTEALGLSVQFSFNSAVVLTPLSRRSAIFSCPRRITFYQNKNHLLVIWSSWAGLGRAHGIRQDKQRRWPSKCFHTLSCAYQAVFTEPGGLIVLIPFQNLERSQRCNVTPSTWGGWPFPSSLRWFLQSHVQLPLTAKLQTTRQQTIPFSRSCPEAISLYEPFSSFLH